MTQPSSIGNLIEKCFTMVRKILASKSIDLSSLESEFVSDDNVEEDLGPLTHANFLAPNTYAGPFWEAVQ